MLLVLREDKNVSSPDEVVTTYCFYFVVILPSRKHFRARDGGAKHQSEKRLVASVLFVRSKGCVNPPHRRQRL